MTTMTRAEHVDYLIARTVEETPPPIPEGVMAALPGIFADLLDRLADPSADVPSVLAMCACIDCIVGAAGDWLRELGYGDEYGYGYAR